MLYLLFKNIITTSQYSKKVIVLSLGCLFFPLLSYGQNLLNLLFEKIEEKYQAVQIDSALQFLEEAVPLLEINAQKAQWNILKAKCLLEQEGPIVAQELLDRAQQLLEIPSDDLLLAEIYNIRGSISMLENELAQAEKWYTQALGIRETYLGPESDQVADTYNNLGALYYRKQQYDEAVLMHQQALTIRKKILAAPHPDLGSSYNNLAATYYDLGYLEEAIQYNQRALEQRLQSFGAEHPSVADSYNNLGNCYFDLYDLTSAIKQHQKALELRQKLGDTNGMADSYNNLGNCWLEKGDFMQAIEHFQQALRLYRVVFTEDNLAIAEVAANQGNAYLEIGDAENALNQLQLAYLIVEKQLGKTAPNLIPVLMNQGLAYSRLQRFQSAEAAFTQAIQNIKQHLSPQHPLLPIVHNNLGNLFYQQQEYKAAFQAYQTALNQIQQSAEPDQKEQATCLMNIGNCAFEQGNYQNALSWYAQAQASFGGQLLLPALQVNIGTNEAKTLQMLGKTSLAIQKMEALKSSYQMAQLPPTLRQIDLLAALGDLYQSNQQPLAALETYESAILSLEQLLTRYQISRSKRQIRRQYYNLYEKGLACALELAQKEGKVTFIERAFALSEGSKALLIREASNKMEALQFAGVPDSLLKKENQLQVDLASSEQLRYEQAHQLDSNSLQNLEYQILQQKAAYDLFRRELEQNYPDYYQLKYDVSSKTLAEVRNQLSKKQQGLLSFFVGDSAVYVFCLTTNTTQLLQLGRQDLEKEVIQLWDGISNFTSAQVAEDYTIYARIYADKSYLLFQKLFAPIERKMELPEQVVIIPDGVLCYLPFDLLIRTEVDSLDLFRFHQFDYLVKDYQLSYAYSATQWLDLQNRKRRPVRFPWLGFAPTFDQAGSELKPLFYNIKEVQNIAKTIRRGRTFLANDAQRSTFESLAGETRILHLATHGMANAVHSDFAYLAFTSQDSTASLLYTRNLYAMQLNGVEMVVLSACETGLGEAQPGEGVISLAHAFTYAGAGSIITTLWSIDDQKTADIMLRFYKNIRKGATKDAALRQARLAYLDQYTGEYAHPFYWAAFVPLGNMDSLSLNRPPIQYFLLSLGLLVFLAIGYRLFSGRWSFF